MSRFALYSPEQQGYFLRSDGEHLHLSHTRVLALRREGVFQPGRDFIVKGAGPKPALLWDLAAAEAAMRDYTLRLPETYAPGEALDG